MCSNTYNVDTNDLAAGLLDLAELPKERVNLVSRVGDSAAHLRKYQKRDLATTSLGAKIRMR